MGLGWRGVEGGGKSQQAEYHKFKGNKWVICLGVLKIKT
jgi:hypothetical protein